MYKTGGNAGDYVRLQIILIFISFLSVSAFLSSWFVSKLLNRYLSCTKEAAAR